MYFFRLGFLDGRPGFDYCLLLSMYEEMIVLKMNEIRRTRATHASALQNSLPRPDYPLRMAHGPIAHRPRAAADFRKISARNRAVSLAEEVPRQIPSKTTT